jgi:hypothetical protein
MGNVLLSVLPLILGAAVVPLWITITLLLLRGEGGLEKAMAFVAGVVTVRALQFILFGRVFGAIVSAGGVDVFDLIPSTLLLVAGLLLIITAVKTWWWPMGDDPDAPPLKWVAVLGWVSAFKAFGMGVVLMMVATKQWIFTLSAIAVIDEAKLGKMGSILAYIFFILAAQLLMLTPIITRAVAPAQSARMVETMLRWLERNNRVITIVASLVFGAWFLARGTTGLLAHGGAAAITKPP